MSAPDPRIVEARELAELGGRLARSDLQSAVDSFLASREILVRLGMAEAAAAVVMDAVAAARSHERRALALTLCHRAHRDDPEWADPLSTMALVEAELGNEHVASDELAMALLFYSRAARHHRRAADILRNQQPEAEAIERRLESLSRSRRMAVLSLLRERRPR